jgi:hypothetical protein
VVFPVTTGAAVTGSTVVSSGTLWPAVLVAICGSPGL